MRSHNGTDAETLEEQIEEVMLETELTDEAYEELASLEDSVVIGVSFWDSSVADDPDESLPDDAQREVIDLDLYLEDNVTLELYGAMLYKSPEAEPLVGVEAMEQALVAMVDAESLLDQVAETDDARLALIFTANDEPVLIIAAGGWSISEWDELPDD